MQASDLTLAKDTIHNPEEPRHFMKLKPVNRRVRILRDGEVLATSSESVRVLELGRDFYDPVLYFQPKDVTATLKRTKRTSHCPLKGDAVYFDLVDADGAVREAEIAWCYPEPFGTAAGLKDLIGFYADKVTIEEQPR